MRARLTFTWRAWTRGAFRLSRGLPVKISDFLTPHQFHRLGLYQDLFRRVGVEDEIAVTVARPSTA